MDLAAFDAQWALARPYYQKLDRYRPEWHKSLGIMIGHIKPGMRNGGSPVWLKVRAQHEPPNRCVRGGLLYAGLCVEDSLIYKRKDGTHRHLLLGDENRGFQIKGTLDKLVNFDIPEAVDVFRMKELGHIILYQFIKIAQDEEGRRYPTAEPSWSQELDRNVYNAIHEQLLMPWGFPRDLKRLGLETKLDNEVLQEFAKIEFTTERAHIDEHDLEMATLKAQISMANGECFRALRKIEQCFFDEDDGQLDEFKEYRKGLKNVCHWLEQMSVEMETDTVIDKHGREQKRNRNVRFTESPARSESEILRTPSGRQQRLKLTQSALEDSPSVTDSPAQASPGAVEQEYKALVAPPGGLHTQKAYSLHRQAKALGRGSGAAGGRGEDVGDDLDFEDRDDEEATFQDEDVEENEEEHSSDLEMLDPDTQSPDIM